MMLQSSENLVRIPHRSSSKIVHSSPISNEWKNGQRQKPERAKKRSQNHGQKGFLLKIMVNFAFIIAEYQPLPFGDDGKSRG
jgi:hypothetical protein